MISAVALPTPTPDLNRENDHSKPLVGELILCFNLVHNLLNHHLSLVSNSLQYKTYVGLRKAVESAHEAELTWLEESYGDGAFQIGAEAARNVVHLKSRLRELARAHGQFAVAAKAGGREPPKSSTSLLPTKSDGRQKTSTGQSQESEKDAHDSLVWPTRTLGVIIRQDWDGLRDSNRDSRTSLSMHASTGKSANLSRSKPAALQLETKKAAGSAQPTAGMQSLRSARFLILQSESVKYPQGVQPPNPALDKGSKSKGRQYDENFLMQFQEVFKEKPSVDWDNILKDIIGDSSDSARPQSARTPSMGRQQPSQRGAPSGTGVGLTGSFAAGGRFLRETSNEYNVSKGPRAERERIFSSVRDFVYIFKPCVFAYFY
jgi:hypothetical protein